MSSPSPNESPDLTALASAASQHVEHAADHRQLHGRANPGFWATAPWGKILLLAAIVALLLFQRQDLRRGLFGVPQAAVQLQAQSVLGAARAAVEQHRKETGELPDRVPLPALDALVTMERNANDYQLKLSMDGRTWKMDFNGTLAEDKQ